MNILHENIVDLAQTNPASVLANNNDLNGSIGRLLFQAGKLKLADIDLVLELQVRENLRFGEAAIKLGLVTEVDIRHAVASQFDCDHLLPGEGGYSDELVAAYRPFSPMAEQFRALRNQLMQRWFGLGGRRLAIIAPLQGVGASYVTANLAVVFSQLGQRTLLIDANLHDPRQHNIFGLEKQRTGLADILAGRGDQSTVVRMDDFVSLSILPAGTIPPNPAELLGRGSTRVLLDSIGQDYDVVLIDTPPFDAHADAATLAVLAGGVLVVARPHQTRYHEIERIRDALFGSGAQIVGTLLNHI